MFTGIISALGRLSRRNIVGIDGSLEIECPTLGLEDVMAGDSIAVNGVCLTVAALGSARFSADVSVETLQRSCFASMALGSALNLEKALAANGRLGGHIVSGHVDGLGTVVGREKSGRAERYVIKAPQDLLRYIASKGSIAVDGVSLTVNGIEQDCFELMLIPHTLGNTIIPHYRIGRRVHLEVDIMARYTERLLHQGVTTGTEPDAAPGIARSTLAKHGFL